MRRRSVDLDESEPEEEEEIDLRRIRSNSDEGRIEREEVKPEKIVDFRP